MKQAQNLSAKAKEVWDEFVAELRDAHIRAGKPTYRDLSARSLRMHREEGTISFSKTTLSRVLNGQVEPRWEFVVAFLRCAGVHHEVVTELWQPRWTTLMSHLHPYVPGQHPLAGEPEQPPPGKTCPLCGCWVTDQDRHDAWHANGAARTVPPNDRHLSVVSNAARRLAG